MTKTFPVVIAAVPEYRALDGETANNYYRALQRRALLSSEVIAPFETALKDSTGYDDDNIPAEAVVVAQDLGGHRFVMRAVPTDKRPGYGDVFQELDDRLSTRLAEYNRGERPPGILTIEDEPYISARDVMKFIKRVKDRVTSEGVKREVTEKPEVPEGIESVTVPLGAAMDLTEGAARLYMDCLGLAASYSSFAAAFEADLLGLTGYSDTHLPEETDHMYQHLGQHIFHVTSVPYDSTKYAAVINGLVKPPPKKKVEKGGDLALVTKDVDIPRLNIYAARKRDSDTLVRLRGLKRRLGELARRNTETKLRQKPIKHYPLV